MYYKYNTMFIKYMTKIFLRKNVIRIQKTATFAAQLILNY
jgi:hypothetical protein